MNSLFAFVTANLLADTVAVGWDPPALLFFKLITIMALVMLNGFFVAAEFALVKVRASQLEALQTEGNRRAAVARKVIGNLDAYLSACQLGITLASLGLGWLGEPFLARILQPLFAWASIESVAVIRAATGASRQAGLAKMAQVFDTLKAQGWTEERKEFANGRCVLMTPPAASKAPPAKKHSDRSTKKQGRAAAEADQETPPAGGEATLPPSPE